MQSNPRLISRTVVQGSRSRQRSFARQTISRLLQYFRLNLALFEDRYRRQYYRPFGHRTRWEILTRHAAFRRFQTAALIGAPAAFDATEKMILYRQTLRSLSTSPGFSILAVFTMALGIAATTALFSIVDAVLLQPLAFQDADRIIAIHTVWPAKDQVTFRVTGGDFMDLRSAVHSFSALALYAGGEIGIRLHDRSRFAQTFEVDPAFFRVLHVSPLLGRLPGNEDANHTAILTTSFARANWSDITSALGQSVTVDNKPYQVIGLLEDKFAFPEKAEVWITGPIVPQNQNHTAFNYYAIGRLRPDAGIQQAQSELSTIGSRLAVAGPKSKEGKTFRAVSLQEQLTAPVRTTLLFLFGAAGLLLLISCANVANLMLARAATRTREIAVRVSLGSSTAALLRLLLAEGCALGTAAAVLALLLDYALLRGLLPLIPSTVPRAADALHMHAPVLLFAIAVSCLTVIACSLIPAFHLRNVDLAEVLKQAAGRGFVGGVTRSRQYIVVAQIALCCVLCVGAGLLSRTWLALVHTPLGFRTEGTLVMYADAPAFEMQQYLQAIRTFETALDAIREIPGVRSAAAVMGLPTGQYGSNGSYLVEGINIEAGQDPLRMNWPHDLPQATFALASPHYFETVGIRLIAGRDFTLRDQYNAPLTAIISQSLARRSFGSSDPLGRRIYCGLDSPKPMTIVGVVSDVRQSSPASKPEPEIYMPFEQHPYYANEMQIAVRAGGDATRLVPEVRKRMHHLAPFMATRFTTFNEMVQDSISAPRFRATLALAFAILAVALAMTGVYSVMAYYVSERSAELGLRIALGAGRTSIIGLVSRRTLSLAFSGLFIGSAGAVAISRVAEGMLYGVHALDVPTYCIGAGAVLIVILTAASIPAWRASRVDPAVALRNN